MKKLIILFILITCTYAGDQEWQIKWLKNPASDGVWKYELYLTDNITYPVYQDNQGVDSILTDAFRILIDDEQPDTMKVNYVTESNDKYFQYIIFAVDSSYNYSIGWASALIYKRSDPDTIPPSKVGYSEAVRIK